MGLGLVAEARGITRRVASTRRRGVGVCWRVAWRAIMVWPNRWAPPNRGARRGSATAAALRLASKSWQQPAMHARARACRVAVNEMGRQGKGAWLPGQ